MKRAPLLLACCLFATATGAAQTDPPLDPDKAFQLSTGPATEPPGATLRYVIADGYYLYRHRLALQVVTPGLALKPLLAPAGEPKDDPYFGQTEIYRRYVEIPVAFQGAPRPGRYAVEVTAQGCADSGFCYAPFKQKAFLTVPAGGKAARAGEAGKP
jgi:thiol:disulfide interchange protein DsbD